MQEQLISFKTAKLAKEKSFENITPHKLRRDYYNHLGKLNGDVSEYLKAFINKKDTSELNTIDAPTQSLLKKWLRDVHNLHAFAWCNASGWGWELEKTNGTHISIMDIDGNVEGVEPESGMFKTYEQALERGLFKGLKRIKT